MEPCCEVSILLVEFVVTTPHPRGRTLEVSFNVKQVL
jgi:hypothetical protein